LNDVRDKLVTDEDKRVYARMFFCCTGSVNDPKNAQQYHLEIYNSNKEYLEEIQSLTKDYAINFKITQRKKRYALYLNKSEEIADFLKFVMASYALFEFEDYRIKRDMMLYENRMINADIANEVKKMKTSNKQIKAINILKDNKLLDTLGDKTIKVAKIRLEHPEDSLQELEDRVNKEISKSNFRYHLGLIEKKANLVLEGEKEK